MIDTLYDILSSALHIFKCSMLDNNIFSVHISEVRQKCYKMPFWNSTFIDESNNNNENLQTF